MSDENSEGFSQVKQWLLSEKPQEDEIDLDFDLIEGDIIDSLNYQELLLSIQEHSGQEFSDSDVELDSVRTLRAIRDNFFGEGC